jgi:hypothetical protein
MQVCAMMAYEWLYLSRKEVVHSCMTLKDGDIYLGSLGSSEDDGGEENWHTDHSRIVRHVKKRFARLSFFHATARYQSLGSGSWSRNKDPHLKEI